MRIRPARGYNAYMYYRPQALRGMVSDIAFIFVNNEYVAVINPPSNFYNSRQVTLELSRDVPLWKQAMEMQMRGVMRKTTQSMVNMPFQKVNPHQVDYYRFKVYECY